jgi:hypothetical protein
MIIKRFNDFILNEKKYFIYTRQFRIGDLKNSNIYDLSVIDAWKSKYNLDDSAHCLFVSDKKTNNDLSVFKSKIIRYSKGDIKNKESFNDESKDKSGYVPEDSVLEVNGDLVYLFIFKKNSNENLRARQNHGFKYEYNIRALNGLEKLSYVNKWDAKGNMDKRLFDEKISLDKQIEYWGGNSYRDIEWEDSSLEPFKANMYWNIKAMAINTNIETGDFKRISGIKSQNGVLIVDDSKIQNFIFNVAFHDNTSNKNIICEYFILMSLDNWKKYLPDIQSNIEEISNMYSDLESHRLRGLRQTDLEQNWLNYRLRYSKITNNSVIKLRFKRDTKGQLRIQSAINYNDFMSRILKENRHIKIS